jgi:hypothetical protein
VKCPKCQHEQPSGGTECGRCGLIFAKWRGDANTADYGPAASEPYYAPVPQRQVAAPAQGGARRPVVTTVVGFLAVCAGWYWFVFWSPGGLPVPADAYRDAESGFALVQPLGWQAKKIKDCKNVGVPLSNASACAVLVMRRDTASGGSGPSIQVTTAPISALFKTGWGGSVRITEDQKADVAEAFEEGMAKSLPGYVGESREVVDVDRIPSIRVVGSASFKGSPIMVGDKVMTVPDFSGAATEHHLTMGGALVPGGTQAFLLVYGCDTAERADVGATFEAVVSSFRLTDNRPTPFQFYGGLLGSVKGDAILGALVSLSLIVLKAVSAGSR